MLIHAAHAHQHACSSHRRLVLIGHSLGAGVAVIMAIKLHARYPSPPSMH
jgi:sn1-specific diacylglycerol lipase